MAVQVAHIRLLINGEALTLSLDEARDLLRVLQDTLGSDPPSYYGTYIAPLAPWPSYPTWTYTVSNTGTGGTITLANNSSRAYAVGNQW